MPHDPRSLASSIGHKIRSRRQRLGLSQYDLATKTKLERSYLTRLEQGAGGDRGVGIETLNRIAVALNCRIVDLLPRRRFPSQQSSQGI